MTLTEKQKIIVRAMAAGVLLALINIVFARFFTPFGFSSALTLEQRLTIAAKASCLVAIFLLVSIGRLAKHRFFTPEDIDAAASSQSTIKARILQAILQNTLEQSVLAGITYFAWAIIMPGPALGTITGAVILFAIGRVLFIVGYDRGAGSRALGFTLTFYPTAFMLMAMATKLIVQLSLPTSALLIEHQG